MKHTFSSLAALVLTLSTSAVASPAPQLVPGIVDTVECLAVDVIVGLLIGDPLAVAYCAAVIPLPTVIKSRTTTIVRPTTVTVTTTNSNTIRPTITSRTTVTSTISSCTASATPFKRHFDPEDGYRRPPVPDCVTQYPTPDVSKACSCISLPTPTITSTRTIIVSPTITTTRTVGPTGVAAPVVTTTTITRTSVVRACPAPTPCGNQGIEFAYYNRTVGGDFANFRPQEYKTIQPEYESFTNIIGGISFQDSAPKSIYGSPPLSESDFVLNHRGYIFARETGPYTFTLNKVDDAAFIWVGPEAYSGWTGANADAKAVYSDGPGQGRYTINLREGRYYAFRIIYGQGPRIAEFDIQVTAPDGTTFLSSSTSGSPYLVRFSCDRTTAPRFSSFGFEF
ncbi:flocculation flo9 [Trichoderma arundinaceum]|uniref:Flocculation flo9 n=1 Tax=Trichoderma arundinaceum TaxID=490622 RepID=A0A395NGS5_TRIAR|nr:flocculation flo9 [Trichoderma arundinaceum]